MLFLRKLHKWLGLLVGVQLVLWAASGIAFAWLDPASVAADPSVRRIEPAVLPSGLVKIEPTAWLHEYADRDLYDLRAISLAGRWLWRIELQDRVELRALDDGKPLQLDASWIRSLALARYSGSGRLIATTLQSEPSIESRASGPVWQAQFDDAQRTALYFAADDGHFMAARNSSWRLYDFFWMLHTMDYAGRDNFNNPWVIVIGMAALWLSISGMLLLLRSFTRADFSFIGRRDNGGLA
jgi:uncharacterized iron-regulated membrane protein